MNLSEIERFSLAGKIRNFDKEIKQFKIYKNESNYKVDEELNYLEVVVQNKVIVQGLSIYKKSINFPVISLQFAKYYNSEREVIDKKIQDVKNNLEEYQKKNFKIQNANLLEPFSIQLLQENQDFDRMYKLLLNICLEKTFLIEEFQLNVIEDSIKILETEFSVINLISNTNDAMKLQFYKTINPKVQSGFSRIQANPCYSSPLFIDQKQTIIPAVAKVSFVQSFINRLRNKVSRVDLLSSGFGFVVSVNDLEDCISYLNKVIQQFGEKEIKKRVDSSQYLYDLQNSKIKAQSKQIEALRQKMKKMKNYQNDHIDALVHERGNNLIYEMGKMQRKQADFQRFLTNIEGDVEQEVRKEMNSELVKLQTDKQILKNQFTEFKRLLTVTFTHEIKTAGREMECSMNNKTIEVLNQLNRLQSFIFDGQDNQISPTKNFRNSLIGQDYQISPLKNIRNSLISKSPSSVASSPKENKSNVQQEYRNQSNSVVYQNPMYLQRQSIIKRNSNFNTAKYETDEDLLIDPVKTTKYINKLRIFYLIKMSSMKQKYETIIEEQKLELSKFKTLQNELVDNQKEDNIIKKELVNVHNSLKEQEKQNKKLSTELEILTFEKLKIEKNRDDLLKKVKQLEDQIKYIDKYDGLGEEVQGLIKERDDKISRLVDKERIMQKTVTSINQSNKKQVKQLEDKIKNETNIKNLMVTKIESYNSSAFPNINYVPQFPETSWQNKCKDLYINLQDIEYENQQILGLLKIFASEVKESQNIILNSVLLNLYDKNELSQLKGNISYKNELDQQLDLVLQSMGKLKGEKSLQLDLLNSSDIKSKHKVLGFHVSPFNPNYQQSKKVVQTQPDETTELSKSKQIKNLSQDISFLYKRPQSRNESPINKFPNQQRLQSAQSGRASSGIRTRMNQHIQKNVIQFDTLNKSTNQ